jgi:histone H3/H4
MEEEEKHDESMPAAAGDEKDMLAPADIPIANVLRIMKAALPPSAKIAKEAKECVQECISEFIAFITSEASEKCSQEKRKTVNGEDILFAMTSLGFENYSEALKIYLTKYRESVKQADHDGDEVRQDGVFGDGQDGSGEMAVPKPKRSHKKRKIAAVTETSEENGQTHLQQDGERHHDTYQELHGQQSDQEQAGPASRDLDQGLAGHNTTW